MPPFERPKFQFDYAVRKEIANLDEHFKTRGVPRKTRENTLIATWNIANLGDPKQKRREKDHALIAHTLSRFDVVAIQEVKDDLSAFERVRKHLGDRFAAVFTDPAGNDERMAFVYDRRRIQVRELFAELALVDRKRKSYKVPYKGKNLHFRGFNRNPYMVAFAARRKGRRKTFGFTLANVHLYYGAKSGRKLRDRFLEVMALADWAQKRSKDKDVYEDNIILLGDMNLPSATKQHPMYRTLVGRGLRLPQFTTSVESSGTNLAGNRPYDQIAFFPNKTRGNYLGKTGVFDFDYALFPKLFHERRIKDFRAYMRYYISDHRLLWAAFRA